MLSFADMERVVRGQAAAIRSITERLTKGQDQVLRGLAVVLGQMASRPQSITDEIDKIPGRRIWYTLSGTVDFDVGVEFTRGEPVTLQVSQDGPFIATHYPHVIWKPIAPENATNFGRWRPVSSWPLPDQVVDTDIIDLAYEIQDGGANRNFQSAAVGPIFSRPDNLIPLPVPTLFAPNATIQFFPTYNQLTWDASTPPTAGQLQVDFPGYRIVNL